jgi:hypothetical protein
LQLSCKPFSSGLIKDDLKIKYNFMSGMGAAGRCGAADAAGDGRCGSWGSS